MSRIFLMKSVVSVGKLRILLDELRLHSEAVSFGADFTSERLQALEVRIFDRKMVGFRGGK